MVQMHGLVRRSRRVAATSRIKPARRASAGSAFRYARYIKSAAWRLSPARLGELDAAGRRCRLCDRGEPESILTIHHRTYANLGREKQRDLTCLCLECHDAATSFLKARIYAGRGLPRPPNHATPPSWRKLVDSLHQGAP